MRSVVRPGVFVASLVLAAAGGGALVGITVADDSAEVARARADASAARTLAARAEAERDRLRAERNRLEAQLASERAPAVCPRASLSTEETDLLPFFAVEYPCGWHVLHDVRAGVDTHRVDGRLVTLTLFSSLPISLSAGGPLADIELADWIDDPSDDEDRLGPLAEWLAEERGRFAAQPGEDRFEAGGGATIHRLEGMQPLAEGADATVVVLLWEYADTFTGARHVVRVFSVEPGTRARAALERLARSFEVLSR